MKVSIHTDASYSVKYGVGAWACFIRADSLTIKRSGKIKALGVGNSHAELMAIGNALALLSRKIDLKDAHISIHTDSTNSIKWIKSGTLNADINATASYIRNMLKTAKSYRLFHVKAHKFKENDPIFGKHKYYRNHWCDRNAKKHIGELIREIEAKTPTTKIAKQATVKQEERDKQSHLIRRRSRASAYRRSNKSIRI